MSFIYTSRGDYVALSEVVQASPEGDGFRIYLRNTKEHFVSQHAWQDAIRFNIRGVIPAPADYAIVEMIGDDAGSMTTHLEPVLGWAVTANGDTLPITACGMTTHSQDMLVPDGRVVRDDGWIDNVAAWQARQSRERP